MSVAYPVLLIAIGLAVLGLGKRLAVLGAAVGAIVGVALLSLFQPSGDIWLQLFLVGGLAVAGFFLAGLAKAVVNVVILVLGALAGAAIAVGFVNLFNADPGFIGWVFAALGGLAGFIMVRRFNELALVILSGLIGGLLVTRGLSAWLTILQEGVLGTLLTFVLAGAGIAYQGGFGGKDKAAAEAQAVTAAPAATQVVPDVPTSSSPTPPPTI
jgi:hypothetical protein